MITVIVCTPGLAQTLFSNYVAVLFITVGHWRTTQINRNYLKTCMFFFVCKSEDKIIHFLSYEYVGTIEMVRCKMGRSFGIKVGIARGEATLRQFPQPKLLILLVF